MADKFIRLGATFNGDGSSSALATVDGGVGAWNQQSILTGTAPAFGTLAAGNVVYIRSKNESNADITITYTVNTSIGSAAGTASSPIRWVVDGGTIWPGVSGTLKFTRSTNVTFTIVSNNIFEAEVQDRIVLEIAETAAVLRDMVLMSSSTALVRGLVDWSACTGAEPGQIQMRNASAFESCSIKFRRYGRNGAIVLAGSYGARTLMRSVSVEHLEAQSNGKGLFVATTGCYFVVDGGEYFGAGASTLSSIVSSPGADGGMVIANGFRFPKSVDIGSSMLTAIKGRVDMFGVNDEIGACGAREWGYFDSRVDANHPYLSAALPTSGAQGWSWKILPSGASVLTPMLMPVASKVYQGVAGALEVSLNLQISDTHAGSVNTSNLWIEVSYTDNSTGQQRTVSSRTAAEGSLATGPAWSSASYGSISLLPRSISGTTPTAVAQDSLILVRLCSTTPASEASDLIFACPEIEAVLS